MIMKMTTSPSHPPPSSADAVPHLIPLVAHHYPWLPLNCHTAVEEDHPHLPTDAGQRFFLHHNWCSCTDTTCHCPLEPTSFREPPRLPPLLVEILVFGAGRTRRYSSLFALHTSSAVADIIVAVQVEAMAANSGPTSYQATTSFSVIGMVWPCSNLNS